MVSTNDVTLAEMKMLLVHCFQGENNEELFLPKNDPLDSYETAFQPLSQGREMIFQSIEHIETSSFKRMLRKMEATAFCEAHLFDPEEKILFGGKCLFTVISNAFWKKAKIFRKIKMMIAGSLANVAASSIEGIVRDIFTQAEGRKTFYPEPLVTLRLALQRVPIAINSTKILFLG